MEQSKDKMYAELAKKILPLYDNGKYDIEPVTEKEKTDMTNRRREIKKGLIHLMESSDKKVISHRRICDALWTHWDNCNPDKIKELRSLLHAKKREIENLKNKVNNYEGNNVDRCPHCKADKDAIREKILIEEFDDNHLMHQIKERDDTIKEFEDKLKNWVQKYQKQSRQAQGFNDQLQLIRRENEITPLAEWRKMMEHHNETLSENKKLKDKVDKLEEKLCCRGDAKMMKRKKKQEKMKKAEEEFNRLKAELSSCSDSDSDTDTTD